MDGYSFRRFRNYVETHVLCDIKNPHLSDEDFFHFLFALEEEDEFTAVFQLMHYFFEFEEERMVPDCDDEIILF